MKGSDNHERSRRRKGEIFILVEIVLKVGFPAFHLPSANITSGSLTQRREKTWDNEPMHE